MDGVFPGQPQTFRHQRRPVENCSSGRGGMVQNGGTRGGTFHGEMDRCRGSQGWTTACSRLPKRDGRTKERISTACSRMPKASRLVLVRSPLLTSHKWRELVSSGRLVCRCHDIFLWCYVCFVLLRFRLYAFFKIAALRLIVLRYADAPIATRVSFFFSFCLLEDVAFSEYFWYHCRFHFVWRVRRTFFPS